MHPGLALVDGDFRFGSVPQISNPTSTGDCPSSGTGSTMFTSSFTGTTRDNMTCFNMK
jgi:hypothetical protein